MASNDIDIPLVAAGCMSGAAALLHVAIIVGGPAWYRFFGAGEQMARAAAAGKWQPGALTAAVALILASWALYAFVGAGLVTSVRLPLVRPALCAITAVYLLRGAVVVPALIRPAMPETAFAIWSSVICLVIGAVHLVGVAKVWTTV